MNSQGERKHSNEELPQSEETLQSLPNVLGSPVLHSNVATDARASNFIIRTCIVKTSWTPTGPVDLGFGHTVATIAVKKGQEGFICGDKRSDQQGLQWVRYARARSGSANDRGWVRADVLDVGRITGPVQFIDHTELLLVRNARPRAAGTCLQKTVQLLYQTTLEEKENILKMGGDLSVITDLEAHSKDIELWFINGIPLETRKIIEGGHFDWDEIANLPSNKKFEVMDTVDERSLIYLLMFRSIDGVEGSNATYIGKTISAGKRFVDHRENLSNPNAPGQAYRVGRRAKAWRMMVLCNLSTSVPKRYQDIALRVSEHTGVSLFRSWTLDLFQTEDGAQFEKYFFDRWAARKFSSLADDVFKVTGWTPCTGRGLNWKTPLFENFQTHTSWTVHVLNDETAGEVRVYRCKPKKVQMGFKNAAGFVCLIFGGDNRRARVTLTTSDFPVGSYVTPIVEIYMGKGQRHPVPMARLPEPGGFSDWGDMNRIGIRFEAQDSAGTWYSTWYQVSHSMRPLGLPQETIDSFNRESTLSYPHATQEYVKAQTIFNTLLQIQYPDNSAPFQWMKKGPSIEVREIRYQHLTQTIEMRDQPPLRREKPVLISFLKNEQALHRMYKLNPNDASLIVGSPPSTGILANWGYTKYCAMCINLPEVKGHYTTVKLRDDVACPSMHRIANPGPNEEAREATCKLCWVLRRPCVWVPVVDLSKYGGRWKFIRIPHRDLRGMQRINGPSKDRMLAECPIAEEEESTPDDDTNPPAEED